MLTNAEAAVKNGIALFLSEGVIDWASRIDFSEVDMWSGRRCIAGQVFAEKAEWYRNSQEFEGYDCSCCKFNGYDYAIMLVEKTDDTNTANYGFYPDDRFTEVELINTWKAAVAATL